MNTKCVPVNGNRSVPCADFEKKKIPF